MTVNFANLRERLLTAGDSAAVLAAAEELAIALGKLPPSTDDDARQEILKLFAQEKRGGVSDGDAPVRQSQRIVSLMVRSILTAQVRSPEYGAPAAAGQKKAQERAVLALYSQALLAKEDFGVPDGLRFGELAERIGVAEDQLFPIIAPIVDSNYSAGEASVGTEWITIEEEILVLTGDGFDEAKRLANGSDAGQQ